MCFEGLKQLEKGGPKEGSKGSKWSKTQKVGPIMVHKVLDESKRVLKGCKETQRQSKEVHWTRPVS